MAMAALFSRSRSATNLPDLPISAQNDPSNTKLEELPRSASFTSLPDFERLSFWSDKHSSNDTSREVSRDPSPQPVKNATGGDGRTVLKKTAPQTRESKSEQPKSDRIGRRKSLVGGLIHRVRGSPEKKEALPEPTKSTHAFSNVPTIRAPSQERPKSRSSAFSQFARKSWMPLSRSPSPNRTTGDDSSRDEDDSTAASSVSSSSARNSSPVRSRSVGPHTRSLSPGLGLLRRSTLGKSSRDSSRAPSIKAEQSSQSTASPKLRPLNTSQTLNHMSSDIPPSPKLFDKLGNLGTESVKRKDELWSVFRALETDYQKFLSKTSGLKANVVRSTLLPFLRSHTQHAANKDVTPEDLERRVAILNKWWIGLVEMLSGEKHRYLSGGDRPVILEAITGIMARPEWRLAPSDFSPLSDRSAGHDLSHQSSSGSLNSSTPQFRAETVHQYIRALFVQNLLAQMSIVVEKMSLKTAPASLVSFCGKAVAYAFYFCPGVADVLVKIWAVKSETIRRVVDEFGLVRQSSSGIDDLVASFPLNLHALGWISSKSLLAALRQRSTLPIEAAKINWHGPWVTRWSGRDGDLFYVFCKHYHILLEEFLPPNTSLVDKARAPGFILVQCQLLATLDSTIHRQPSGDAASGPPLVNFDEMIGGADASADALPLPPSSNASRMMTENRLIMLLRDFLVEKLTDHDLARRTFAGGFAKVLHAAAKKTSQFDHNACFILCDFLEETLGIYTRFQDCQGEAVNYVDWKFWLNVSQKMLQSENTMTEIRLFSLIYGSWSTICRDEGRKETLCQEFLLSSQTFRTYFLHWCPMVRAYYTRLLCWRICRFDGEASKVDTRLLALLYDELKLLWANYLFMKRFAKEKNILPPSTAPCLPAPGRRLLIIRVDTQAAAASLMLGFDGIIQNTNSPKAINRRSSMIKPSSLKPIDFPSDQDLKSRKRWSIMGKVNNLGSTPIGPGHQRTLSSSPPRNSYKKSSSAALEELRSATAASRSRPPALSVRRQNSNASSTDSQPSAPTSPSYRTFSFKFSLEWNGMTQTHPAFHQNVSALDQRLPHVSDHVGFGGGERALSPPRLPGPAHSWLVSQVPGSANEVLPKEPLIGKIAQTKYTGRALAEWALLVLECNNFIQRRMSEGVPALKLIEVPVLGVEGFRKFT